MHNFKFLRPKTVDEAVAALSEDEAEALGGGQTLIPTMKQRLAAPEVLVSLTGIDAVVQKAFSLPPTLEAPK